MNLNIVNKNIIKATYGKDNNIINVTELIKSTINNNIIVNNIFFKNDPCKGHIKELKIYYDDKTIDIIPENKSVKFINEIIIDINDVDFGFIIIRYVINDETNSFWTKCYKSIRKFYKNKIVIIDDNSKKQFIKDIPLENTIIVNSEYPKRGELLPYYYYYHNKYFDRAVVFHDGIEVKRYYNYGNIFNYNGYGKLFSFENKSYKIDLDFFKTYCDNIKNGDKILKYHEENINNLTGCFGIMYVIDYDFLVNIEKEYNFLNLINHINTRKKRQTLERFSATLFKKYCIDNNIKTCEYILGKFPDIIENKSMFLNKKLYGR